MSNDFDTITKTLSSPPPPTLEEILATFNTQEDGDKELLAAIVRAKEAEELVGETVLTWTTELTHMLKEGCRGGKFTRDYYATATRVGTSIWPNVPQNTTTTTSTDVKESSPSDSLSI